MKISGSASIPGGEYNEDIRISGSGKISSNVRCPAFSCSGCGRVEGNLTCENDVKISGSCHISGNIEAKSFSSSGSSHVDGDLVADNVRFSGAATVDGNIKCKKYESYGSTKNGADISAEEAIIEGAFNCKGLLNAEKVIIKFDSRSNAGSIGGSEISICPKGHKNNNGIKRLPLISGLLGRVGSSFTVNEAIEGDIIALEHVSAPSVTGRIVAIGAGCSIKSVKYIETCEIDPSAEVGSSEKI